MSDLKRSTSRNAVVTGGASGIGRRTVERLLADDWQVWVFDLQAGEPHTTSESGMIHFLKCDLRNREEISNAFQQVSKSVEGLDALICSAGIARVGELDGMSVEDADLMLDVNVRAPWLTIKAAVPLLRRSAHPDNPARVVVVGSIAGIRPKISSGFYGATKAAAHVLAQVYAVELGPSGITVNVVAPGSTSTPMSAAAAAAGASVGFKTSGVSPLGRIGQPDDVADAILFLIGDQARYINGAVLPVDGGTRAAYNNRQ